MAIRTEIGARGRYNPLMVDPNIPSVGMDQVDSEHALQVQMLRDIEAALAESRRDRARELMTALQEFTEAHFATEQILMRLHSYPGYGEHEAQHGELLEQFSVLEKGIATGAEAELPAASSAIRQWLTHHIGTADRAFVEYLQSSAAPIAAPALP